MNDDVNNPQHYNKQGIEVIDVIEAYELPYHLGNVIKYVLRHQYKGNPIKDLKKAQWYLTRYIEAAVLEEKNEQVQQWQQLELPLQGRVAGQAECGVYNTYYKYDPTVPDRICAQCDREIKVGEVKFICKDGEIDIPFCSYSCSEKYRAEVGV
jgi:hypothetical protein